MEMRKVSGRCFEETVGKSGLTVVAHAVMVRG